MDIWIYAQAIGKVHILIQIQFIDENLRAGQLNLW